MENSQKNLYVLLTRSDTIVSRLIHWVTDDDYTHCSLGFDRNCTEMFSFARIHRHFIFPGGFVRENINTGVIGGYPDALCALFELTVSHEAHEKVKRSIELFLSAKKTPPYDVLGVFRCYKGRESADNGKYFCSRFVAEILGQAGAITLKKPASLYRPADFSTHTELDCLYVGTVKGLRNTLAAQKSETVEEHSA